ncbi:hypothetical protein SAMN05444398_10946 [Roseovarius pacificus]|uniref:Uncharacterized protein n=2 Tax=Roseovarius pacificus TaxID=337701 RepID=A0A1M7FM46_9RHOB|nr:hypothetical protein GCM10011315_30720 [Roseovarius pacificus]SHM05103.1 hypothetical protein SAMN05444398_10946 [Roseovarius pacificus]
MPVPGRKGVQTGPTHTGGLRSCDRQPRGGAALPLSGSFVRGPTMDCKRGSIPMKYAGFIAALLAAGSAQAHPGHLSEVAGHGHWLGAAALGAAIAIGLWAGLKGRKAAQDAEAEEAADEDAQEA